MRTLLLLVLFAIALPGCEPEPDVEPLPCRKPDPGTALLGEGDLATGFQALEAGDDLEIVFGPQGMHMVVLSARVTDMEPAQAGGIGNRVSVAVRYEGVVVGGTVADMEPSAVLGETTDFLGVRAVFTEAEVETLDEVTADVEVIVRDGCGRELADSLPLRLVL